jgi:leader peptidase (prepilin peptidase) / N-methyltransferase
MTYTEFFASNPLVLPLFALLLGLMIGSFLNVVIYRLPLMMEADWRVQCHEFLDLPVPSAPKHAFAVFNLAKPSSHCPHCKHALGAGENVPVLSYVLQRGKCKHCKAPISARYPIMETVTGLLSMLVAMKFGFAWPTLAVLVLTWALIALTMIDVDHQLLPDDITLPLLWLGLLVNTQGWLVPLESAVWGAIGGYGLLWSVYWLFKLATGKEGMGFGDFKLLGALGAWLGWQALPQIILLSSLVGAVVGISLIVIKGRDKNVPIPFGPYLAAAGFIALMWGELITKAFFAWAG